MAAVAWERWQQAAEMLARDGITVQTSQGIGAHPAAMIERQACQTYQNLISRMGLSATPSQARYKANKTPRLKKAMTISDLMSRQAEEIPAS
jgi:phage terminase small subunit